MLLRFYTGNFCDSAVLQHIVISAVTFVFTVVFCTLSFNLIRVAYVVRHPCSDFTDMSRRHINCRIIIIIIIITVYQSDIMQQNMLTRNECKLLILWVFVVRPFVFRQPTIFVLHAFSVFH